MMLCLHFSNISIARLNILIIVVFFVMVAFLHFLDKYKIHFKKLTLTTDFTTVILNIFNQEKKLEAKATLVIERN